MVDDTPTSEDDGAPGAFVFAAILTAIVVLVYVTQPLVTGLLGVDLVGDSTDAPATNATPAPPGAATETRELNAGSVERVGTLSPTDGGGVGTESIGKRTTVDGDGTATPHTTRVRSPTATEPATATRTTTSLETRTETTETPQPTTVSSPTPTRTPSSTPTRTASPTPEPTTSTTGATTEGQRGPAIDTFAVDDRLRNGTTLVTVDWRVVDPDSDLDSIRVALVAESDAETRRVEQQRFDAEGDSSSGSTTLALPPGVDVYEVRLEAVDETGNSVFALTREVADDTDE